MIEAGCIDLQRCLSDLRARLKIVSPLRLAFMLFLTESRPAACIVVKLRLAWCYKSPAAEDEQARFSSQAIAHHLSPISRFFCNTIYHFSWLFDGTGMHTGQKMPGTATSRWVTRTERRGYPDEKMGKRLFLGGSSSGLGCTIVPRNNESTMKRTPSKLEAKIRRGYVGEKVICRAGVLP